MSKERPSPESFLKQAKDEEQKALRGKLKIYLGAAPGVGKTYTMLEDALAKRAHGLDVVVGVVESHGRKEIENFLSKLEILPRQEVAYHGQTLFEFDLDGALKRNPAIILIDEMAHTNVPGLRHNKRWQDIKEILDRGIDVYTTLNVQHIESLNDVVGQIIHTRVKETIPDSMLEMADAVELVDLPPEDLLKRLQEGKVYIPAQVERAKEHFFRKGNLSALRELSLRATAERVGEQMLLYRQGQGIKYIWPTKERLLVCVGTDSHANKLIRATRRMASSLQAEWLAVHVDTHFAERQHNNAIQNLRLAEQLGADTKILTGKDIVKEILHFAHEQNITKIIVGKHKNPFWKKVLFKSITDKLIRDSGEIDIYMITAELASSKPLKPFPTKRKFPWGVYAISIGTVCVATLINFLLSPMLNGSNIIMVYLVAVTIVALFGKTGPSILSSVLSVIGYAYFFTHSPNPLDSDTHYIFTLIVMLLVTQTISHLTILAHRQATAARTAEQRTSTLHSLSRQLASTRGVDKLLDIAVAYIATVFNSEVLVLLAESGNLIVRTGYGTKLILNEKEKSVAQWVYDLGQIAGLGTDTLPYSDAIYVPMLSSQKPIGVLQVRPKQANQLFTPEQMHLLEACANQVALAIEVDRLHEQSKQTEIKSETDRIRNALLDSVSHDLRTPLVAVIGAASTLMEMSDTLSKREIRKIGLEIYSELEQLNRLINNLLQIGYLEAESVKLHKEFCSLEKFINTVRDTYHVKLNKRIININVPYDLPDIPFDKTLMQEVFINLIDNAIKFTPDASPIDITAEIKNTHVVVSVMDKGPGIVLDEVNKLFEKFYRGRMLTTERGLGLGLAICRSIIKAHGGEIWAENRPDGGAAFCFSLSLA